MTRIDQSDFRPASDIEAIEEAFRSLVKYTVLNSPDDYIDLRRDMRLQFDDRYRNSSRTFSIDRVLSKFADSIWRFSRELQKRDGRHSPELIRSAFEAFCTSGELILDKPSRNAQRETGVRGLLSMASGPQLKYFILSARPIGENLNSAADVLLDDKSEIADFAAKFEEALSRASEGDEAALADVSELIFGDELIAHMSALSDAFEDYYFGSFIIDMGAAVRKAREAYEGGQAGDAVLAVEEMEDVYRSVKQAFDYLRDVALAINTTTKNLRKGVDDEDAPEFVGRNRSFLRHFASVGHDYNNFLAAINGYLQNLSIKDDKLKVVRALENVCLMSACSTIPDLLAIIRTKINVVRVSAEYIDGVSIPERYRRHLFRSVFELVKNADKYRDRENKEIHTIDLLASLKDCILRFTVEDNGIGIGDVDKALREGVRERPDLAEGSGLGLAGIVSMSEENGWRFSLESELGFGTKATLEVDTSGWDADIISSVLGRADISDLKRLADDCQAIVSNFETLASSWIGYEGALEYVHLLRQLSGQMSVEGLNGMARFLTVLLSEGCRSHFAQLIERYEDKIFVDMMDEIDSFISRAAEAIRRDEYESLYDASHEFESGMDQRYFNPFSDIRRVTLGLDSLVDFLKSQTEGNSKPEQLDRMKAFILSQRMWTHDFGTIVQIFMGEEVLMVRKANEGGHIDKDAAIDRLKNLKKWDFSSIPSMVDLIANLVGKGSDRVKVGEGLKRLPSFEIREGARRHLFRVIFELVRNSDKYRDGQKKEQFTKIDAMTDGSKLRIEVEDNGVGIADVAKVLEVGVRERSDLARGSGFGLAGIVRMSEENGWRFSLESELGVGTKATLEIDTSNFAGGPCGGVGSGTGQGHLLGASAAKTMSTMNAALGAGVLLGFMPSLA